MVAYRAIDIVHGCVGYIDSETESKLDDSLVPLCFAHQCDCSDIRWHSIRFTKP